MTGELSGILDHVDRIGEARPRGGRADLARGRAGERAAARRAAAELPHEVALAPAPDPARRRLPGALAAGRRLMSELLELTRRGGGGEDRGRRGLDRRVLRGLARRGRRRRAQRLPLADRGGQRLRGRGRAAAGDPGRGQGHLLHRGHPDHGRLAHPRGLPAALHRDRGAPARRRRRPGARQDQHGRVRDGVLERELRLRAGAQPVGPRARPRRLLGRLGRRGRRRPRSLRDRHRHRRLDPPARLALRDRRPQAHLWRDLALRDDRLRLLARPVRAADPRRHRRGAAAGGAAGARPLRLDLGRDRGRDRRAGPRGPQGAALRGPGRARPRRDRRRGARGLRGDAGADRGARRRDRRGRAAAAPSTASPPTT